VQIDSCADTCVDIVDVMHTTATATAIASTTATTLSYCSSAAVAKAGAAVTTAV
jgi:hypothetical protein